MADSMAANVRKLTASTASTRGANAWRAWPSARCSPVVGTEGRRRNAATSTRSPAPTTAAKDPRHPTDWPSSVPSGIPTALDIANPAMISAIARPVRSGATIEVAVTIAAAMKRPCTAPMTTRAATKSGYSANSAGSTFAAMNTAVAASSTCRRSNRVVRKVSSGPPMASPSAFAVTRAPAADTDTARSAAIRSSMPTTSISAQPITKAPANSTASTGVGRTGVPRSVICIPSDSATR